MLAVRVPPSASSTSQSTTAFARPGLQLTTARKLRPMSAGSRRLRPSTLPPRSRGLRVGGFPATSVFGAQPALAGSDQERGTVGSTQQVHSPWMRPIVTGQRHLRGGLTGCQRR